MTKKHRLFLKLWKILLYINGIKKDRRVKTYSYEKSRFIHGTIKVISGTSITRKDFTIDIDIGWDEPLQGEDMRYHAYEAYGYIDLFHGGIVQLI